MDTRTLMIAGVQVKPLKPILDERGRLMELLRSDDPIFEKIGQVYVTVCKPRVVKGWHYHKLQTDHFVCLQGTANSYFLINSNLSRAFHCPLISDV